MATIYYGVAGEGRGHAGRTMTLVEELRKHHDVVIYSSGLALELLEPKYAGTDVEVRSLPPVEFRYTGDGRVSYVRTFAGNVPYLMNLSHLIEGVIDDFARNPPDLVITDFEPVLPRAAAREGIPYICIDHQHFLTASSFRGLPRDLRHYARFMAPWVHMFVFGQEHTVTSSFFRAPPSVFARDTTQVGVMLRPAILAQTPEDHGHVLAYMRRGQGDQMLEALGDLGRPVKVYGLGERETVGHLEFCAVHPDRFVEDLATSTALVSTAGNQLVGEALYLDKPVLAIPEPGNFEQRIHAHFLERMGAGVGCALENVDVRTLYDFLQQVPKYRARIDRTHLFGNPAALACIEAHLPREKRRLQTLVPPAMAASEAETATAGRATVEPSPPRLRIVAN